MARRTIVKIGDDILRKRSKEVTVFDRSLGVLLDDMKETMLHADGVGLMTNYGGVYLGDRRLDELMAELDGRGALTVMHPTQPAVMVPDVNEEIPLPAFEYFAETTRAFLNMAQNDTFTLYPNIRWVVPHVGAFLSILADRFESFALMLRFAAGVH